MQMLNNAEQERLDEIHQKENDKFGKSYYMSIIQNYEEICDLA
jgi:hypothetical protein